VSWNPKGKGDMKSIYKLTEETDARGNVWWTITNTATGELVISTRDQDEADAKATEFGIVGVS
jgi:hypothetical protein